MSTIIPLRTYKALLAAGLTEEQAKAAWKIVVSHLGIASPGEILTPKKSKSKPKHKKSITEDEAFWRQYEEYKSPYNHGPLTRSEDPIDGKPKHTIEITDMINSEIERIKTEPKNEEPLSTTSDKKIIRKNKSGQW